MELKAGDRAPDFSLLDSNGKQVKLSDFRGSEVALYFYPEDDTPGCTKEACAFRDDMAQFREKGVIVLGVSPDSAESHRKFAEKYSLPFQLLSDMGHKVAERYGVWREKSMYGRKYFGILRSTFLIGKGGRIRAAIYGVKKPEEHSREILEMM